MENEDKRVIIKDIDMPFKNMVFFGVKWMIAMIPAILIFYLIIFMIAGVIGLAGFGLTSMFN